MTHKSIDVLLPYWGDFQLLKKTVESVLSQTHQEWILRIFDDHYPSTEAADYFEALNEPRIIYIRHKKNIGITNNFNFALAATNADYCVMIGCDDIMLPDYLEIALQRIGNADMYQPGVQIIDKNGRIYNPIADRVKSFLQPKKSGVYGGENLARSLCVGNWLYFPSITWKTATIKKYGFDAMYSIAEDLALELNIIKDGGVLFYDNESTFQYRRFSQSLSSKEKKKGGVRFGEERTVYSHFANEFRKMGWNRASRAASVRLTSRIHELMN